MTLAKIERVVDLGPDRLFAVAADIEAYPEFLPHCVKTRILERSDDKWLVDNLFRWGPFPFRFRTRAVIEKPRVIDITALPDAPFDLTIRWRFEEHADATRVTFEMALALPGPGLTRLFAGRIRRQAVEIEDLFVRRALETSERQAAHANRSS